MVIKDNLYNLTRYRDAKKAEKSIVYILKVLDIMQRTCYLLREYDTMFELYKKISEAKIEYTIQKKWYDSYLARKGQDEYKED